MIKSVLAIAALAAALSAVAFVTETKSTSNERGPWDYRGSYDLSSPAGHVGIGKVVYIDATNLPPPPGTPTRFWAFERPLPEGGGDHAFRGNYPTSYDAYLGLVEWAKEQGLTAVKINKAVYISKNGDDKNDGLTPKTPVRSYGRFFMLVELGDDIHFMEDEYYHEIMGEAASERERSIQENMVDGLPPWTVKLPGPKSNQ